MAVPGDAIVFSKPTFVKLAPSISAVERVKKEKLKSLHAKTKSLSLSSLLHLFPTQHCIDQEVLQCNAQLSP